jgi:hypothetical protein
MLQCLYILSTYQYILVCTIFSITYQYVFGTDTGRYIPVCTKNHDFVQPVTIPDELTYNGIIEDSSRLPLHSVESVIHGELCCCQSRHDQVPPSRFQVCKWEKIYCFNFVQPLWYSRNWPRSTPEYENEFCSNLKTVAARETPTRSQSQMKMLR